MNCFIELLHTLRLWFGVIVVVAFQKIDRALDTETCTESYYQSLQYTDCTVEKCHKVFLLDLPAYVIGMMK